MIAFVLAASLAASRAEVCAVNTQVLARIERSADATAEAHRLVLERIWPRAAIERAVRAHRHGIASYEIRCVAEDDDEWVNPYGEDN